MPRIRFAAIAIAALAVLVLVASGCTKPITPPPPQTSSAPQAATPTAEATTTVSQPSTTTSPSLTTRSTTPTVSAEVPKTPASKSTTTMKTRLTDAALAQSKVEMEGQGAPYKLVRVNVALDAHGTWWGHVVTLPTGGEQLNFWAKYEDGGWNLSLQDVEPPAPATYFPASVIPKLNL